MGWTSWSRAFGHCYDPLIIPRPNDTLLPSQKETTLCRLRSAWPVEWPYANHAASESVSLLGEGILCIDQGLNVAQKLRHASTLWHECGYAEDFG